MKILENPRFKNLFSSVEMGMPRHWCEHFIRLMPDEEIEKRTNYQRGLVVGK